MTAATTKQAKISRLERWRRCIACLLCVTTTLMPAHSWGESDQAQPAPNEQMSDVGREAQQFGQELIKGTKLPSLTEDGKIDLGEGVSIGLEELYPNSGEKVDVESLKEMHDSPKAMSDAGEKAQQELEEELKGPNPSIRGMVYDVVRKAKNRERPTFANDKDFAKSRQVFEPESMQGFMDTFTDCVAEEKFHRKEFTKRIPDYRHCHRLHKPKGGCTIHHTIEISTEPTDIVFLVDNSGSMGGVIRDLVNNVRAFANLINQGKKGNLRVGGAAFREKDYLGNRIDLTENITEFEGWLGKLGTRGGETYPFDAVSWAANHYQWRNNVHRIVVLVGNEDQGGNKHTAASRLASLGITLYTFHDNRETKSLGINLADYFSGPKLLKFAQMFTVVRDDWHPQSCIDDALATLEEFCVGHYTPTPRTEQPSVIISGFEVSKGDSIYNKLKEPPLQNISKLTSKVDVSELRCNYNHGQGSCWVDPQGEQQCLQNNQDVDECAELQKKGCVWISSECVEGAKGRRGVCYVFKEKYDCGEDVVIPTLEKSTEYRCAGPIRCMGEDCIDVSREQSSDFARAAALLQASQFMTQDMDCDDITNQNNVYCRLFGGKAGECKVAVGGVQNCCEKPDGISMNDYLSLVLAVPKLDAAITSLSSKAGFGGAYQAMRQPFVSAWDKVKSPFTSGFESISNKVKPLTEPFKKVYEQTIGKLKAQISKMTAKVVGKTGAQGAAGHAAGAAASEGTKDAGAKAAAEEGTKEAGKQMAEQGTKEAIGSLLGTVMTVYTVYSVSMLLIKIIWKCEQQELEMNAKRSLDSCHYVGSYCKSRVAGVCVESRESYCCFNSPLSRIMQEQLRPQLGLSFGSAKNPQCAGIPMEQLGQVDWSQVNLDEWLAILQKNGRLPTVDNLDIDSITGKGSVFNVDGKRKNALERAEERIWEIDVDAIRRKAAESASADNSRKH